MLESPARNEDESAEAVERAELTPRQRLVRRVIYVMNLLILYVLSIGPMFWLWYEAENMGETPFLRVLYAPLRAFCFFEPVENWLNNYINWWIA